MEFLESSKLAFFSKQIIIIWASVGYHNFFYWITAIIINLIWRMCIFFSFFFDNFKPTTTNVQPKQSIDQINQLKSTWIPSHIDMELLQHSEHLLWILLHIHRELFKHTTSAVLWILLHIHVELFQHLQHPSYVFLHILMEIFLQSHLGNLFSSRASSSFGPSLDFTTIEQHLSSSVQPDVKKCHLQQQFFDTNDWSTHSSQHEYPFALTWNCFPNNWLIDWSINSTNMNPLSHWRGAYYFNTHSIIGIPSSHSRHWRLGVLSSLTSLWIQLVFSPSFMGIPLSHSHGVNFYSCWHESPSHTHMYNLFFIVGRPLQQWKSSTSTSPMRSFDTSQNTREERRRIQFHTNFDNFSISQV